MGEKDDDSEGIVSEERTYNPFTEERNMMIHVSFDTAEDGWIVATCPALPGCVSQGQDEKEALKNIEEAITAWMWAEDQKAIRSMPADKTFSVVSI